MRTNFLEKALKYGIYAAAFVPLVIFSQFISPFHFGKVVVFRSIVEILAVFYFVLVWADRSYFPKRNSTFWSLFAFVAVFGVTTFFSAQVGESFWGTLERMGGFWTFSHYFVYFLILTSVFKSKEDWLRLLDISIFVGVLSALYGFGQKTEIQFFVGSGNRARIFGTIGNAALFAGYELVLAFLSLTLIFKPGNSRYKNLFYLFAFILAVISVLMAATRGAILGLVLGIFIFAVLYVWAYQSKKAKNIVLGLVSLGVIFLVTAYFFGNTSFIKNSRYLSRIMDVSTDSYTIQTRFWAWQAGIEGWKENLKTITIGWGPENFNIPFSKHFNPKFFTGIGAETFFDRAHNMFVEVLVTMGLAGLVSYIGIFFFLFRTLWLKLKTRSKDESLLYIGLISLLVAYIAHNFFFFDTSPNWILFFTIVGFVYYLTSEDSVQRGFSKILSVLQLSVLFILLILCMFLIYRTNIQASYANYATTRAITFGWQGDTKGALAKFKESVAYDVAGRYEYRHRYAQYVFENYGKVRNNPDEIKNVIKEVQKNADSHPLDYLPELYLSRLNILLGKEDYKSPYNDEALKHSRRALEISPTFVRAYYETGQAYINKRELAKARDEFKKASELNPDVGLSYWYWAVTEADLGNVETAQLLVDKSFAVFNSFAPSETDYLRMINIYDRTKNYKGLQKSFESLIAAVPDNPDYRASLAAVYVKLGMIDEAVKEAKNAADLDGSFEAEARAFVKSLRREW